MGIYYDLFIFIYDYLYPYIRLIWLFDYLMENMKISRCILKHPIFKQSSMFDCSIPSSERSAAKQGYVSNVSG